MVTVRLDIKPLASGTTITTTGETLPAGGELSPAQEAVDTLTGTKEGFQKKVIGRIASFSVANIPSEMLREGSQSPIIYFYLAIEFFLLETLDRRVLPICEAYRVAPICHKYPYQNPHSSWQ